MKSDEVGQKRRLGVISIYRLLGTVESLRASVDLAHKAGRRKCYYNIVKGRPVSKLRSVGETRPGRWNG